MCLEEKSEHYWQTDITQIKVVEKEWGTERIIRREPYACKVMTLYPDKQVSLHWHCNKKESFLLIEGELIVELVKQEGKREIIHLTHPYSSITIENNTPHTFYCPDGQEGNTVFIEASTTDSPNDSFRIYPSGTKGEGLNNW